MEMTSPSLTTRAVRGRELLLLGVDLQLLGAADAGLAHAAGDDGGVRGLAAAAGQHALGGDHPGEVVGVGLPADQDDLLAAVGPLDGGLGGEHGLADGGARRGVHALGELLGVPARRRTAGTSAAPAGRR